MAKWAGIGPKAGPITVLLLSLIGVLAFGYSQDAAFDRTQLWPYFSAWIAVASSSAGIFGFTRATAEQVTRMTSSGDGG
jgi:hypothetical protein